MRKGWREVIFGLVPLLCVGFVASTPAAQSPAAPNPLVRLTIEVGWSSPAKSTTNPSDAPDPELVLELSEGQVADVVACPGSPGGSSSPHHRADGTWTIGAERSGRIRARLETTLGANLRLRAGGQAMLFPIATLLDGPQHSPPQAPMEIIVERLPWDVVSIVLGQGDGIVAPKAKVPVSVGFNILTTDATEADVRCAAELRPSRGGEPVWKRDLHEKVVANSSNPQMFLLSIDVPEAEGTYVLELRTTWEAIPTHEGNSVLSRLIRRGKRGLVGANGGAATRRATLAVVASEPPPLRSLTVISSDQDVDSLDLTRLRGNRPSASGRSALASTGRSIWAVPDEALAEPTRRDRLRGWITRAGGEVANLGPADATGLAWSALELKVPHPGRPHRLSLSVIGGHPSSLGVALVGPGNGGRAHLLLDACASGPPILPEGPPSTYSWLVWPDVHDPVLVLVNRAPIGGSVVQVGPVMLTELADVPAGLAVEPPASGLPRGLGVALGGPDALDRFGGGGEPGDILAAARNLAQYLSYCGASAAVVPETLSDRPRRQALDGQAAEDSLGPDRLAIVLRVLARRDVSLCLELALAGPLPGLPPAGSPEALARGLVRVDRRGLADGPTPSYHPLHPDVVEAMRKYVVAAIEAHKEHARLAGVLIRLGSGATLLGSPDTGFDDTTFTRFVREAFDPETGRNVPGVAAADPGRFALRARFLAGSGRQPWLTWRSKQIAALYGGLAEAVRGASPGLVLTVATPALGESPAGTEARRADQAGLAPSLAWRAVGFDLDDWPEGDHAPVVLRGLSLSGDELAHDLATSPELDAKVAARTARGMLLDSEEVDAVMSPSRGSTRLSLSAQPIDAGPTGDEPLGHALAALDARWMLLAVSAVSGHEERMRRFAKVFRALPAESKPLEPPKIAFGVAVRTVRAGGLTYVVLANDTPYPIRLDTVVNAPATALIHDLGRAARLNPDADASGRHLVLDLLPFGVAAVRIAAPDAKLVSVTPYPSETVMTSMQARYDELSTQLSRLTRGGDKESPHAGPANPGFEPAATKAMALSVSSPASASGSTAPAGWQVTAGATASSVSIDTSQPHSGRGSLRLEVADAPGSVSSDEFSPNVHSALLVRAWLRSDKPDAKVRLWIEGESAGKPYKRVSELLAQPTWAERAVRASDVPPTGLDSVRLRFELLSAGTLWVDDLTIAGGENLSEPERRNARNALLAALQAYKEKRYADFARLAGSHWTRRPGVLLGGGPEGAAADRAGMIRTGDASALPQGRRLR